MERQNGEIAMAYKRGDALIRRTVFFLALSKLVTWTVEIIGWPFVKVLYGFKIRGRKNLAVAGKRPVILVSNHTVPLDPLLHALALLPQFTYFTLLEDTVLTPVLGSFVRLLGGIPIPSDSARLADIEEAVAAALHGRGRVHFYPEGECFLFSQEIRDFKAGAFYYAIRHRALIVPMVTVLKSRKGRVRAEAHILAALEPPAASGRAAADLHKALRLARSAREAMQAHIDAAGGDKSLYRGPMPRIKGVNDRPR